MADRARIARLRRLIAELERHSPSPERDRALWNARARVVALDVGPMASAWREDGQPESDWSKVFAGPA